MPCVHTPIETSLDRWSECHWHLHQMERNYHEPEPFRYALKSFIRAIADVPEILNKNLERHESVRRVIKPKIQELKAAELFSVLRRKRNFLVHQGMLSVKSKGSVRSMEGTKIKCSFPFRVEPWESSDQAYERFKEACRTDKFWRGIGPDCDAYPAILRTWMIADFPERDLLEVAFEAWQLVGELLSTTAIELGGEPLDLRLPCRHNPAEIRLKIYGPREFFLSVDGVDLEAV